jgi:hypothetical protein
MRQIAVVLLVIFGAYLTGSIGINILCVMAYRRLIEGSPSAILFAILAGFVFYVAWFGCIYPAYIIISRDLKKKS